MLIAIPFLQSAAPKQISKGEVDSSPDPQEMLSSDALGHSSLTQLSSLRATYAGKIPLHHKRCLPIPPTPQKKCESVPTEDIFVPCAEICLLL